jgi:hypothetical protein
VLLAEESLGALTSGASDVFQGFFQFFGPETEGTGFALVGHTILLIDEVNAIWPAGVGVLGEIVECVNDGGKFDSQFSNA